MGMAYSTDDLIARQKAKRREKQQKDFELAVRALRDVQSILGPATPPCCEGCKYEWDSSLEIVNLALEKIGEKND